MGKLFVMPSRSESAAVTPAPSATREEMSPVQLPANLHLWLSAPRERNIAYAPVYTAVSVAMQSALRQWTREWLNANPEAIERRVSGYSLLAFSCTRPFRGRTTSIFTYDVQQTSALDNALRGANRLIAEHLNLLRTDKASSGRRVVSKQVTEFVSQKRSSINRMFHVETLLMDEILKFTQINIAKLGLENATLELRSAFKRHLNRFTEEFDMASRVDELLAIATSALNSRLADEEELPVAA